MELVKVQYVNILSITDTPKPSLSYDDITKTYADAFEGLGKFEGKFHLVVDPTVTPKVHPFRKSALALRNRLKAEFDRLESLEVLTPVTEPTS